MTHAELDKIEANLQKVEALTPGSYGIVTALELVAEIRNLLPPAIPVDAAQSQISRRGRSGVTFATLHKI
jgi:hypothetical protein